ncbi:unnamed protein product [Closterium sp. NIES-54]
MPCARKNAPRRVEENSPPLSDTADPVDQHLSDITLAAQGEDCGVTRVFVNHQQEVSLGRERPGETPPSSTASTSTSTTPTSPSSALASLALAGAASPARGRRSADRLKTTEVGRSSRSSRGQEGGRGTSLKDGGARVTTRGSYSDYARLCC